ncbi:C40 family peptidase, partial [Pseudomonas aeruginosa]|nr:C40 family peptidase [Pseudomonas aeruginosa]
MRKQILSAIRAHAAEEYPREACGVIVGAGKAQQYVRCRNTAGQPQEEFRMHPGDYAAAEDLGEVVAIVHSHPDATS